MYFTLLIVVILTAIALVAVALGIANAISPRSFNPQKGEAYECGIPTRGKSWMPAAGLSRRILLAGEAPTTAPTSRRLAT